KAVPDADFEVRQADLYVRPARELIAAGKWEAALAVYTTGLGKVDAKAKDRLTDARVGLFLTWGNALVQKGEYEAAVEVLKKGAAAEPKGGSIRNNTLATYDAWAKTFTQKKDWAGAIAVYDKGLGHLPGNGHLKHN